MSEVPAEVRAGGAFARWARRLVLWGASALAWVGVVLLFVAPVLLLAGVGMMWPAVAGPPVTATIESIDHAAGTCVYAWDDGEGGLLTAGASCPTPADRGQPVAVQVDGIDGVHLTVAEAWDVLGVLATVVLGLSTLGTLCVIGLDQVEPDPLAHRARRRVRPEPVSRSTGPPWWHDPWIGLAAVLVTAVPAVALAVLAASARFADLSAPWPATTVAAFVVAATVVAMAGAQALGTYTAEFSSAQRLLGWAWPIAVLSALLVELFHRCPDLGMTGQACPAGQAPGVATAAIGWTLVGAFALLAGLLRRLLEVHAKEWSTHPRGAGPTAVMATGAGLWVSAVALLGRFEPCEAAGGPGCPDGLNAELAEASDVVATLSAGVVLGGVLWGIVRFATWLRAGRPPDELDLELEARTAEEARL